MDIILWVVFGGIVDWLASIFTHADGRRAVLWNGSIIAVGVLIGSVLIAPILRSLPANADEPSLLLSFLTVLQ